jgi:hypothetical protein
MWSDQGIENLAAEIWSGQIIKEIVESVRRREVRYVSHDRLPLNCAVDAGLVVTGINQSEIVAIL